MQLSVNRSIGVLTLDKIIDRNPVTVSGNVLVTDAIALMSGISEPNAVSTNKNDPSAACCCAEFGKKSSYVIITENTKIVGIFTEKDVVKLIASGKDFSNHKIAEVMSKNIVTLQQYQERDVSIALKLMHEYNIRHLPVVVSDGQLIGIVTYDNIRSQITPGCLLKMRKVSDIVETQVLQSEGNVSLVDLAILMREHQDTCTVIIEKKQVGDENSFLNVPIGIVTARDLVKFQAKKLDLVKTKAKDVMSQPLFPVNLKDSLWQTHQFMLSKKVRRLVVLGKNGELAGIINQSSILQVFDPVEMSRLITVLQHQVTMRSRELEQTNHQIEEANKKLQKIARKRQRDLERSQDLEAIINSISLKFDRIHTSILETVTKLESELTDSDPETKQLLENLESNSKRGLKLIRDISAYSNDLSA